MLGLKIGTLLVITIFSFLIVAEAHAESFSIQFDKSEYFTNDSISITGKIYEIKMPVIAMRIYDTFGTPSGFYFAPVTPDLKFSTNFPAKSGVNFKINGTYSIKAHFAESSSTTSFDFYETFDEPIPIKDKTEMEKNKKNDSSKTKPVQNDSSKTNKSQNKKNPNELKSIISNVKKQTSIKSTNNDLTKKVESLNLDKIKHHTKNNLTVEDIELGLMLNQINLTCDSSKYTDTITYYDRMGPALYRLCKFDNSLKFFDESLINDPGNVEILSNKGSALGKLGYYSEALVYYDYALGIDPQFLPAINNKANSLVNMGKYNEAKLLYEYAIENNPGYETARKNLLLLNSEIPHEKEILEKRQSPTMTIDDKIEFEKFKKIKNINSISSKENQSSFFEEVRIAFSSLFRLLN